MAFDSFGDNDPLAALTIKLVRAEVLVLLTTVDGFRIPDKNGRRRQVEYLDRIDHTVMQHITRNESDFSTGGMETKLQTAKNATQAGCHVVLAIGRERNVLPEFSRART